MKEIKEFIQELCDCAKPSANGSVVALEDATRIVAHAFAAGMNFQDHEIKRKHKFRHFEKEDPENWWYGKTERCQKELDEALEKLRKTPNMAYFEVGYGQLYPMVKRYDYEKALRIYEQEQKETSMEGQE